MDKDRFNHIAAEILALKIMVASFTNLAPDKKELRKAISGNANKCVSILPTKTEEQREFIELMKKHLNFFSSVLSEQEQ